MKDEKFLKQVDAIAKLTSKICPWPSIYYREQIRVLTTEISKILIEHIHDTTDREDFPEELRAAVPFVEMLTLFQVALGVVKGTLGTRDAYGKGQDIQH